MLAASHAFVADMLSNTNPHKVPLEWDWRNETCGETSCVSMVKNQGHCGSCWTFSTVGMMESLHAIKTGKMVRACLSICVCARLCLPHSSYSSVKTFVFAFVLGFPSCSPRKRFLRSHPPILSVSYCQNKGRETLI